jgi:hypothetical protein
MYLFLQKQQNALAANAFAWSQRVSSTRGNEILRKTSAYFAQAEGVRQPSLCRPK